MAYRLVFHVMITCVFLFLPHFSQALLSENTNPNPFKFLGRNCLQELSACHKGETVKGVRELKHYLKKFGYLDDNYNHSHTDEFDDQVESAIKTYQINFNLKSTGTLDPKTMAKIMIPRCGVADIIKGTTSMRSGKNRLHHHLHSVSHYAFFSGLPRWPSSKTSLTYSFLPNARVEVLSPVCARAFSRWASVSQFTFNEIKNYNVSDIKIGVYRGEHGDGLPFDGRGGSLAHARPPTDGRFHYDGDERWAVGAVAGAHDLETAALHEIGHLLGLAHSSVVDSIMYPMIPTGFTKDLNVDDIQGIQILYNQ